MVSGSFEVRWTICDPQEEGIVYSIDMTTARRARMEWHRRPLVGCSLKPPRPFTSTLAPSKVLRLLSNSMLVAFGIHPSTHTSPSLYPQTSIYSPPAGRVADNPTLPTAILSLTHTHITFSATWVQGTSQSGAIIPTNKWSRAPPASTESRHTSLVPPEAL
jgi:hypothetical protein